MFLNDDGDTLSVEFVPFDDDVASVENSREEAEDGEGNVDEQVDPTTSGEKDAQRGEEQGQKEETNVGASHL
jgi:hypothetical protein